MSFAMSSSSSTTALPSVLPAVPRHLLPQRFAHLCPESPTKQPRAKRQETSMCLLDSDVDETIETLDHAFSHLDEVLGKAATLHRHNTLSAQDERVLRKAMRDVQYLLDLVNAP